MVFGVCLIVDLLVDCFLVLDKLVGIGIEEDFWGIVVVLEYVFEKVCDFVFWVWCIGWIECNIFGWREDMGGIFVRVRY